MKRLLLIIIFCYSSMSIFSQNESVVSENYGKEIIINSKKSLSNFKFNLPLGFKYLREGKDNTTIKLFTKGINIGRVDFYGNEITKSIEFGVSSIKIKDYPKFKILINKSYSQIKILLESNILKRKNKSIDSNEFSELYETNNSIWLIGGTWSEEKMIYTIIAQRYSQNLKQIISFEFYCNFKGDKILDIINIKKLINTFKFL